MIGVRLTQTKGNRLNEIPVNALYIIVGREILIMKKIRSFSCRQSPSCRVATFCGIVFLQREKHLAEYSQAKFVIVYMGVSRSLADLE